MFEGLSLQKRLFVIILLLTLITLAGSMVTVGYIRKAQELYISGIEKDMASLTAAQKMDDALVMQKGLTTYYFLTGSVEWLEKLEEYHRRFQRYLDRARETSLNKPERDILNNIESRYLRYAYSRDQVISLYKEGKRDEGATAHWGVRDQFFNIRELSESFKNIHETRINSTMAHYRKSSTQVALLAWLAIPVDVALMVLLMWILYIHVFRPIRELSYGIDGKKTAPATGDEVKTLKKQVDELISDFGHTREELVISKEQLVQVEKMAVVGKLAAGVAHSVRNPLTSVKMRLFSLERSVAMTPTQKEDFEVISEEIRQIDTVLGNFLEFSRPPKLRRQMMSPSDVVDMALQLLKHRLESYGTKVMVKRTLRLPRVLLDPEQLKEVLVNLIVNACEAMGDEGTLAITEEIQPKDGIGSCVMIRVTDSGPGIPESIQNKIFQPFFSSKEEGSGLGLSIAIRILNDHGGQLLLKSEPEAGATFTIVLPCKEDDHDDSSHCG